MPNFMQEHESDPCRNERIEEGGTKRLSTPHRAPFRGSPSKSQGPSRDASEITRKQQGNALTFRFLTRRF
jgi:hypothetical protein